MHSEVAPESQTIGDAGGGVDDMAALDEFLGIEPSGNGKADAGAVEEAGEVSAPRETKTAAAADSAAEPGEEAAKPDEAEAAATAEKARQEQAAKAAEKFRQRRVDREQLRQQLAARDAELEERKTQQQFLKDAIEELRAARTEPKPTETDQPQKLTDDPDTVWEKTNAELIAQIKAGAERIQALEEKIAAGEQTAAEQREHAQRYQQESEMFLQDAAEWAAMSEPGFFGQGDPETGEFQPGVYEAWEQTLGAQLLAGGTPREEVVPRIRNQIRRFYEMSARDGHRHHPFAYLEQHAAVIGVGAEAPGSATPAASPSRPLAAPSPVAEAIDSANAAKAAGLTGTISTGSRGSASGTPKSLQEMVDAKISGNDWARQRMAEVDDETFFAELDALEAQLA